MSENLNLTELIKQLQAFIDAGLFEYMPTNISEVRRNGYDIELFEAFKDKDAEEMQDTIDSLKCDLRAAERESEDLEYKLREAREHIEELKAELKNQ